MRKNENVKARVLPKVLATGVLAAMLCSMAPSAAFAESVSMSESNAVQVHTDLHNVNNDWQYPGVTLLDGKISYSLPSIVSKNVWAYTLLSASVNGKALAYSAPVINSTVYLSVRDLASKIGASSSYDSATRTMTVTASGFSLSATDGGYVTYVNGRPIFSFSPNVIMSNGRMYIAASTLAKATGMTISREGGSVSLDGSFRPLAPASSYYREDEVFWLARIITAEAQGESLLGQIAVGNVILNRVASDLYPNTIYGVIFDRKWGVQFSPILDGSIYNTPTYTATLAAKICLEGTKLSEDSLFFLNPTTAESSWIVRTKEYLYSIGGHDFYR